MDREVGRVYERPTITDFGSLAELTQASLLAEAAHFATFGAAFAVSVMGGGPNSPPGRGPESVPLPDITQSSPSPPEVTTATGGGSGAGGGAGGAGIPTGSGAGTAPGSASGGGAGTSSGGGGNLGGPVGGGGDSGGSLPFTGYGLALVAGVGLAMTAASRAIRRFRRR